MACKPCRWRCVEVTEHARDRPGGVIAKTLQGLGSFEKRIAVKSMPTLEIDVSLGNPLRHFMQVGPAVSGAQGFRQIVQT